MQDKIKCWQCGQEVDVNSTFCNSCKSIQSPFKIDHFKRLNLPANFEIGEKILDVAYFALQRVLHPDRFANKTDKEKKYSMGHTVDLNDAYLTIKSPLKRAEYLLSLKGVIVNQDNSDSVKPSQELLMESLNLREQLDQATKEEELRALSVKANDDYIAVIENIKTSL